MQRDEFVENPDHAPIRNRPADLDRQTFAIPFVHDGQRPKPAAVIQRVGHEVERPRLIQDGKRHQRLPNPAGHPALGAARQVQPQAAIHAMHPLVVPRRTFEAQPVVALPEAPAWISGHDAHQRRDDSRIPAARRHRRPIVRRPRQPHDVTGATNGKFVLVDAHLDCLSFRGRRYHFRAKTSLIAAFSSASSAYIRFSLAFSPSSSRSRCTSAPNQARALREVDRWSPPPRALVRMDSVAHDWVRSALDPNDPLLTQSFQVLFPGFVACGMAALGALVLVRRRGHRHVLVLYGGLTIVGFALSLGTNVPGYGLLFEWLLPLRMIRAPSRFSLIGLLGIAVLSAVAIQWFLQWTTGRRRGVAMAVMPLACLLHLAETAKPVGREPYYYHPPPPIYRWLAEQPGEFAVVELPSDRDLNTFYLVYSTYHWKPLVNGFDGSFITAYHHRLLFDVLSEFPEPRAVRELSQIQGLRYVVVHTDPAGRHFRLRGHERTRRRLAAALDHLPPTLRPVWSEGGSTVLELVDPPGGWVGSTLHRFVPGSHMKGRLLRFEARALGPRVRQAGREIAVFVNGTEVYRRPVESRFATYALVIPEEARAEGVQPANSSSWKHRPGVRAGRANPCGVLRSG